MSRCTTRPAHSTPAANSTKHAPHRPDAGTHADAHPTHPEPQIRSHPAPTPTPHRTLSEMFFRPFPELPPEWQSPKAQDTLLREYINHRGNFADFALDRGLSIDQLYDWLHSEQVIEKCKRLEAMANRQSALLATLIRPDALKALADVIISPDSTPSQRRLAASAVLRACDKLNKPARQSAHAAKPTSRAAPTHAPDPQDANHPLQQSRVPADPARPVTLPQDPVRRSQPTAPPTASPADVPLSTGPTPSPP